MDPVFFFPTWIHYHLFKVIKSSWKMSKYLYVSIQIWIYDNHLNVNIEPNEEKLCDKQKMFGFKFSVQAWFISCQLDKKCLWSFAHTYFFEFIKMNPNKQVNYYDTPWSFRNGLFNYNYYLISHASLHQNINGKLFFEGAESHVFYSMHSWTFIQWAGTK